MTTVEPLDAGSRELLEFERAWWKYQGRREAVVRERFGTSLTRHLQRVLGLLDDPRAEAYDPEGVRRLRTRLAVRKTARLNGAETAVAS